MCVCVYAREYLCVVTLYVLVSECSLSKQDSAQLPVPITRYQLLSVSVPVRVAVLVSVLALNFALVLVLSLPFFFYAQIMLHH